MDDTQKNKVGKVIKEVASPFKFKIAEKKDVVSQVPKIPLGKKRFSQYLVEKPKSSFNNIKSQKIQKK